MKSVFDHISCSVLEVFSNGGPSGSEFFIKSQKFEIFVEWKFAFFDAGVQDVDVAVADLFPISADQNFWDFGPGLSIFLHQLDNLNVFLLRPRAFNNSRTDSLVSWKALERGLVKKIACDCFPASAIVFFCEFDQELVFFFGPFFLNFGLSDFE